MEMCCVSHGSFRVSAESIAASLKSRMHPYISPTQAAIQHEYTVFVSLFQKIESKSGEVLPHYTNNFSNSLLCIIPTLGLVP